MSVSVAAVMRHCRNFFPTGYADGTFRITGNVLADVDSPWVYIQGSRYHDGVWRVDNGHLTERSVEVMQDEEFSGRIWFLDPPEDFLELCKAIREYDAKNPAGAYASEAFGAYSYSRAAAGKDAGWAAVFAAQLAPYRRMFSEV